MKKLIDFLDNHPRASFIVAFVFFAASNYFAIILVIITVQLSDSQISSQTKNISDTIDRQSESIDNSLLNQTAMINETIRTQTNEMNIVIEEQESLTRNSIGESSTAIVNAINSLTSRNVIPTLVTGFPEVVSQDGVTYRAMTGDEIRTFLNEWQNLPDKENFVPPAMYVRTIE